MSGSSNLADLPPVLTSCGKEWQLADLPADLPLVLTSCGQEWQWEDLPADLPPSTDILWSRMATGRSTPWY